MTDIQIRTIEEAIEEILKGNLVIVSETGTYRSLSTSTQVSWIKTCRALVEIMKNDGSMARYPDLEKIAEIHNLKLITIKDLIEYLDFKSIQY